MPCRAEPPAAEQVVRSSCDSTDLHTDYLPECGTDAFTLITPLADYTCKEQFQVRGVVSERWAHAERVGVGEHTQQGQYEAARVGQRYAAGGAQ